jgi:hypothetical protein
MKNDRREQLPVARTERLIVKEVDDEVLVYDLTNDKAHCLNDTAARVWKNCDGKNSVADISTSLGKETGVTVDERVVWLALDQLEEFKLLAEVPTAPAVFAGMSRRQLMRNLGVAAIALPVVVSIVAPTSVQAASCGTTCTGASDCAGFSPGCNKCNPNPGPGKSCGPP